MAANLSEERNEGNELGGLGLPNFSNFRGPLNGMADGTGSPMVDAIYTNLYTLALQHANNPQLQVHKIKTGPARLDWIIGRRHPDPAFNQVTPTSSADASVLGLAVSRLSSMRSLDLNVWEQTTPGLTFRFGLAALKLHDRFWQYWFPYLLPKGREDEELYTLIAKLIERCPADKLKDFIKSAYRVHNVLFEAVLYGDERLARLLLDSLTKKGMDINRDLLPIVDGENLMIKAAQTLQPNMVRLLLEYGADVTVKNPSGRTAAMAAQYEPNLRRDHTSYNDTGKQRAILGLLRTAEKAHEQRQATARQVAAPARVNTSVAAAPGNAPEQDSGCMRRAKAWLPSWAGNLSPAKSAANTVTSTPTSTSNRRSATRRV